MSEEMKVESEETRDWVEEAYECFIKNATDLEPTDPVKAIGAYFEKNATAELKEQAKADGKTPATCWKFIEAVARKALHGSGHIDPVAVYAIAMHYFQDLPVSWDKPAKRSEEVKVKSEKLKKRQKTAPASEQTSETDEKTSETPNAPVAVSEAPVKKTEKKPSKKHYKKTQGFFFDMMETDPVGGKVQA